MIKHSSILASVTLWILGSLLFSAQAQIRSSNAATYITVDITPGEYHFVHIPFTTPTGVGTLIPSVLLGTVSNLPIGTKIVFYDNSNQVFESTSEVLFPFGWFPNVADLSLKTFWLFLPESIGTNVSLHLYGNTPSQDDHPSFSKYIQEPQSGHSRANSYIGYDYPIEKLWVDTDLASKARVGDIIYFYDPGLGGYFSTVLFPFGWLPVETILEPGRGYLFYSRSAGALTWTETKPYAWP